MTARDYLTYIILAVAIALLIAALVAVLVWVDVQMQRDQRRADELESELADTRKEKLMFQSTLKGLVEGTATDPGKED